MIDYSKENLSAAFTRVGLKKGDSVFCHSNVGFLGTPAGGKTADNIFYTILNAFLDVIGEEGTLIVPTFTYSFPQQKIFDPVASSSDCGFFTEMLRQKNEAYRSLDPCVSVAAIGRRAREFTIDVPSNSYGENSFFARFHQANGIICNINYDAGSTFIHYVERELQVPYRFDKTFTGIVQQHGKRETKQSTIWVRYLVPGTEAKCDTLMALLREQQLYNIAEVGRGFVGAIAAASLFNFIQQTIKIRPWFLTEAEILNLIPEIPNYDPIH